MTIDMNIDTSGLKALIAAEIVKQDGLAQRCATQMMLEGVNAAQKLCRKDTGALKDSIAASSSVARVGPCQFTITLANGVDYGIFQELGPSSGKRVWAFNPHIRPAAAIVAIKGPEIVDRVYNG